VDSTLLLKLALEQLADRAVAVLASSPAYPESEQKEARAMARSLGARLVEVDTHELELEAYTRNNPDRCFHCKEELFETLEPIRVELGLQHLAYGATADDAGDHRPGHGSAVRRGVRFPLLEAGLAKADIRAAARQLGLANWNKPSFACLSSRIPHGTEVTIPALRRIEVEQEEMSRLLANRERVVQALQDAGYKFVSLDLEGYSTGSLNRTWKPGVAR